MDLKRALETQRMRLLCLVTGWMALLRILSVGPLAVPVPCCVREFFESVLIRAECAAHYLVQASASMQAGGGLIASACMSHAVRNGQGEVPSAQDLLRRMAALREVLENLPRIARRLLKVRIIAGDAFDWSTPLSAPPMRGGLAMGGGDWTLPRVERPPDKSAPSILQR